MGKHFFPFFSANIHKYIYKLPVLKSVEKELVEDMRLFLVENLWLPNENGQYRLSVIETSSYEHCIKLFGNPKEKKFADNEQGIKVQDITWIIDDVKSELSATYLLIDKKGGLEEAGELLKQAIEMEPENIAIQDSIGWYYFKVQNYESAKLYLEKAAAGSQDEEILMHLGELYHATGEVKKLQGVITKLKQQKELEPATKRFLKQFDTRH